mgnify:CR=1 FL=1
MTPSGRKHPPTDFYNSSSPVKSTAVQVTLNSNTNSPAIQLLAATAIKPFQYQDPVPKSLKYFAIHIQRLLQAGIAHQHTLARVLFSQLIDRHQQ